MTDEWKPIESAPPFGRIVARVNGGQPIVVRLAERWEGGTLFLGPDWVDGVTGEPLIAQPDEWAIRWDDVLRASQSRQPIDA